MICFSCGSCFWGCVFGFFLILITFLLLAASNYFIMKNIRMVMLEMSGPLGRKHGKQMFVV